MCPFEPFKMVARAYILIFDIILENIEARKIFQEKKFLLLPIV